MSRVTSVQSPPYFGLLPIYATLCILAGIVIGIAQFRALADFSLIGAVIAATVAVFVGFLLGAFIYAFQALVASNLEMRALMIDHSQLLERLANNGATSSTNASSVAADHNAEVNQAIAALEAAGHEVTREGGDQWRVKSDGGFIVATSPELLTRIAKSKADV